MRLILFAAFSVLIAQPKQQFLVVHPKGVSIVEEENEAGKLKPKLILELNQTGDKLEAVSLKKFDNSVQPPDCPVSVNEPGSLDTLKSLLELLNKRIERRGLLDKKLRLLLTAELLKKLNQLEKKHNIIHFKPITADIDPYELYERLVVLIAVLAN